MEKTVFWIFISNKSDLCAIPLLLTADSCSLHAECSLVCAEIVVVGTGLLSFTSLLGLEVLLSDTSVRGSN